MKYSVSVFANGNRYDIPKDQEESFRATAAQSGIEIEDGDNFRVNGEIYTIPKSRIEEFKSAAKGAESVRPFTMSDGTEKYMTPAEVSKYLRSKEYRESDDYTPPQIESPTWAAIKGGVKGAAEGAYAGGKSAAGKVVSAIPEVLASATEAVGNAINLGGNAKNAVGDWFVNSGRGVKKWLDENVKSRVEDDLGYEDWSTRASEIAGDAAGMAVKFAPAAYLGPAYLETVMASDGINAYARSFDAAKSPYQLDANGEPVLDENGQPIAKAVASDAEANLAGLASGLINYYGGKLLMKSGGLTAGIANPLARFFAGGAVSASAMGVQNAGNKGVENAINGKPITEGMGDAFLDGASEGFLFHGMNEVAHAGGAAAKASRETKQLKEVRKAGLLAATEEPNGPEFLNGIIVNKGMDEAVKARKGGADVSRKMATAADLPDNLNQAERNQIVDAIIEARETKALNNAKKIDEVQSEALHDEIAGLLGSDRSASYKTAYNYAARAVEEGKELDDPVRRAEIALEAVKAVKGGEKAEPTALEQKKAEREQRLRTPTRVGEAEIAADQKRRSEEREMGDRIEQQAEQMRRAKAEKEAKEQAEYDEKMAQYEEARAQREAEKKKFGKAKTPLPEKPVEPVAEKPVDTDQIATTDVKPVEKAESRKAHGVDSVNPVAKAEKRLTEKEWRKIRADAKLNELNDKLTQALDDPDQSKFDDLTAKLKNRLAEIGINPDSWDISIGNAGIEARRRMLASKEGRKPIAEKPVEAPAPKSAPKEVVSKTETPTSADAAKSAQKLLGTKFYQDEASLKREMSKLPPQATKAREAYEVALAEARKRAVAEKKLEAPIKPAQSSNASTQNAETVRESIKERPYFYGKKALELSDSDVVKLNALQEEYERLMRVRQEKLEGEGSYEEWKKVSDKLRDFEKAHKGSVRPVYLDSIAEADRLESLRSSPEVLAYAKRNGMETVDGKASPGAVRGFLKGQVQKAVNATKRLFKDAQVEVKDRDYDEELDGGSEKSESHDFQREALLSNPPAQATPAASAKAKALKTLGTIAQGEARVKKARQEIQRMLDELDNGTELTADELINRIADRLKASPDKAKSRYRTYYLDFANVDGQTFTLRLSDHSAHSSAFKKNGSNGDFNISVVVHETGADTALRDKSEGVVISQFSFDKNLINNKSDIRKVVESVKGIFDNGKFVDLTGKATTDSHDGSPLMLRNGEGRVVGTFNPNTKKVTLYRGADEKTVYHELIGHGVEDWARRNNTTLHGKLLDLARTAPESLKAEIREKYPEADEATVAKEIIARFAENKGAEKIQLKDAPTNWVAKTYVRVRDAILDFAESLGFNRVNLNKLESLTPAEVIDRVMGEIAKGKTLGEIGAPDGGKMTAGEKWANKYYDRHTSLGKISQKAMDAKTMQPGLEYDFQVRKFNVKKDEYAKLLKEGDVAHEEVAEYMKAKGAEERLARGVDVGIDKATIDATLKHYENHPRKEAIERAADFLWKMQDEGLKHRLDNGLISKEQYDEWTSREKFHVPFRSAIDEVGGEYFRSHQGMEGKEFERAEGRYTESGDPVAFIFEEYADAHLRAIENNARKVLADEIGANAELGRISTNPELREMKVNGDGGEANVVKYKAVNEDGNVVTKAIILNGERGAAAASSYTNRDLKQVWEPARKFMRFWSATATEWSPTFALRNAIKDNSDVALTVLAEKGSKDGVKWIGKYAKNQKAVRSELWEFVRDGTVRKGSTLEKYFKEGGMIGGFERQGYENIRKTFSPEELQKTLGKQDVKTWAGSIPRLIKSINSYTELATRLSAFKTNLEGGMSEAEAAKWSRQITVDFNRKGNATPVMNTLFMFSNSVIGSKVRQLKAINNAAKTSEGRRALALILGLGVARAWLEDQMNTDDDENAKKGKAIGKDVSEYTRKNSLFYFRNGDRIFNLASHDDPLSQLAYLGDATYRLVNGKMNGKEYVRQIAGDAIANSASLLGVGSPSVDIFETDGWGNLQGFTPTALQPVVQLMTNTNFMGSPIYQKKYTEAQPDSYNGRASTSEGYKAFVQLLNDATGGNAGRSGAIDITPETAKHWVDSVGKNVGKDAYNFCNLVYKAMTGTYTSKDTNETPIVRDITRKYEGNDNRYFQAKEAFDKDKKELDTMKSSWTAEELKAFREAHPHVKTNGAKNTYVERIVNGFKSSSGAHINGINDYRKLENGMVKNGSGKWIPRKTPPTDEQVKAWREKRMILQAKVIEKMGL